MKLSQPFKKGDIVMAPSHKFLVGAAHGRQGNWIKAVIEYPHPAYGWCQYRAVDTGIPLSAFNEYIFTVAEYDAKAARDRLREAEARDEVDNTMQGEIS